MAHRCLLTEVLSFKKEEFLSITHTHTHTCTLVTGAAGVPNIISREAAEEHKGALSLNYEGRERGGKEGEKVGRGERDGT